MLQRYYGSKPPLYKVVVKVGEREFSGEGISAQAARHDAASKALQLLASLPVEDTCPANRNATCMLMNIEYFVPLVIILKYYYFLNKLKNLLIGRNQSFNKLLYRDPLINLQVNRFR